MAHAELAAKRSTCIRMQTELSVRGTMVLPVKRDIVLSIGKN